MPEQTERICTRLVKEPYPVEQRGCGRHRSRLRASYRLLAAGKHSWTAKVRDLCASGLALVLDHRFEIGLVLVIEFETAVPGLPAVLLARVTHTTLERDDRWVVGCEFAKRLSDAQLQALLD